MTQNSEKNLLNLTIHILETENPETLRSKSRISKLLSKCLKNPENDLKRKFSSLCILYLSNKSKIWRKKLENFEILKKSKNEKIAFLSLNEVGVIRRSKLVMKEIKEIPNFKCFFSKNFFFKFFKKTQNDPKIEILSITEIKHHLKSENFEFFPDPKNSILWASYCPSEPEIEPKNVRSEFRVKKRSKTQNFFSLKKAQNCENEEKSRKRSTTRFRISSILQKKDERKNLFFKKNSIKSPQNSFKRADKPDSVLHDIKSPKETQTKNIFFFKKSKKTQGNLSLYRRGREEPLKRIQ